MKTVLAASSLLILFAAAPLAVQAAAAEPAPFTAENCRAARQALDAMGALLRDAQALGTDRLTAGVEPHLEALRINRPSAPAAHSQASDLLGDMRDSIDLMRGSPKEGVRRLALQRLEQDHGIYGTVLEAADCPAAAR